MPKPTVTLLFDDAGDRLCCAQDGPAVAASALLQDACAEDMPYCPACARAALAPIVRRGHARCVDQGNGSDDDELLQAILSLTTTPPDDAARGHANHLPRPGGTPRLHWAGRGTPCLRRRGRQRTPLIYGQPTQAGHNGRVRGTQR